VIGLAEFGDLRGVGAGLVVIVGLSIGTLVGKFFTGVDGAVVTLLDGAAVTPPDGAVVLVVGSVVSTESPSVLNDGLEEAKVLRLDGAGVKVAVESFVGTIVGAKVKFSDGLGEIVGTVAGELEGDGVFAR